MSSMEDYVCCGSDIPEKLYRVDYYGARTKFSPEDGFRAGDTTRIFGVGELNIFKRAVEKHFTWSCHDPLPFISLFSDREHAENWGRKQPWHRNDSFNNGWSLHIIDTTQLKMTTLFFRLSNLVEKLNLDIPKGAQQHIQGAFVCLHRIPPSALVGQRSPEQVDNDREDRRDGDKGDIYDYLAEYGDDDSDREMLQENYNTIFEKNIEDNW